MAETPAPVDAPAALAALRAQGAQQADPVRFRHIEALARRAAQHSGATRQLLDARLGQLLAAAAQRVAATGAGATAGGPAAQARLMLSSLPPLSPPSPSPSPLAGLLQHINAAGLAPAGAAVATGAATAASAGRPQGGAAAPELKAISRYRSTWARLGAERRLQQALHQVPDNAGPLNTQRLLHEALTAMHGASPGYLQNFMAQVEALLWLEQVGLRGHLGHPGPVGHMGHMGQMGQTGQGAPVVEKKAPSRRRRG